MARFTSNPFVSCTTHEELDDHWDGLTSPENVYSDGETNGYTQGEWDALRSAYDHQAAIIDPARYSPVRPLGR